MKKLVKKYFTNFVFFYQYLGYRLLLVFILSLTLGLLDGLGLSMFLPLLQLIDGNQGQGSAAMGNLSFLVDGLKAIGLPLNLVVILSVILVFFGLKSIARYFGILYRVNSQQYFIKKIRFRILNGFNRISFKDYIVADIGRIQNTMSGEVEKVARAFYMYVATLEEAVLVFVYIGFAFFVDIRFAFLVTVGGALSNFIFKTVYKRTQGASVVLSMHSNVYQSQIIQHVGNFKYLKATSLLDRYSGKLKETIELIEGSRRKMGVYSATLFALREPMVIGIVALVVLIHINFLGGALGPILTSLLFFYRALTSLTSMQTNWNKYLEQTGAFENIKGLNTFLDEAREKTGSLNYTLLKREIKIEGVKFKYDKKTVLRQISFDINRNETVAFVGESGSGKTTLVNIVAGLLHPDEGSIFVDGVDLRSINSKTYQARIGYVTQEPVIFNDTVFNNIAFWDEPNESNIKRFEEASKRAMIFDFIEHLPDNKFAMLGNNGINLSGGQKQRIAIARELYKDIDLLILDEATSALDSETEKMIRESIDNLKGRYTILIVAHRLSTIKNADKIILMSNGQIMACETFYNLIEKNQKFKAMVEMQEITR